LEKVEAEVIELDGLAKLPVTRFKPVIAALRALDLSGRK
jgi:hypothetical protein